MRPELIFIDNPTPYAFRVSLLTNRYVMPLALYLDEEHGLQWHEWVVVFCLALRKGWSAKDISAATGRPKNTISRAVHKLLRMALITRTSHPEDARIQVLALTPKGRRFYVKVLPRLQVVEHSIYSRLNKKEQAQFIKLLDKLHNVGKTSD